MVTLEAITSYANGISRVEWHTGYPGCSTRLFDDTTAPYTFTANTAGMPAGTFPVFAVAVSTDGVTATSSPIVVTLNSTSNRAPTVQVTSPGDGSAFPVGSTVILQASATDTDGSISKVEFYSFCSRIGEASRSGSTFTFTATTVGVPAGTYPVHAVATDNRGAISHSRVVFVTLR